MKKLFVLALLTMALASFSLALSPLVKTDVPTQYDLTMIEDYAFAPPCEFQCHQAFNQCRKNNDLCSCVSELENCLANCN